MKAISRVIYIPRTPARVRLYFIGDLHIATILCDKKKLKETIDEIKNTPNAYWIGMGDYGDYIGIADRRFDLELLDYEALKEKKDLFQQLKDIKFIGQWTTNQIVKTLKPIADKGLFLLKGNHEETMEQKSGQPVMDWISDSLNLPNVGFEVMAKLKFRTKAYDKHVSSVVIYASHGWGYGRRTGAKLNRIEEMAESFIADIYVAGHVHSLAGSKRVRYYYSKSDRIHKKDVVFIRSGSFKLGRVPNKDSGVSYEEKRGYHEQSTGPAIVDVFVYNNKNKNWMKLKVEL